MYIHKRLLRTFMVFGLAAATSAMAQTYRDDRYVMGKDGTQVFDNDTLELTTAVTLLQEGDFVPNFYVIPQNVGDPMDESAVILGYGEGVDHDQGTKLNAIQLNTEGDLLEMRLASTNKLTDTYLPYIQKGAVDVYINTMMQFVPSEDPPGADDTEDAKIALYVDTKTSKLVVRHGMPIDPGEQTYFGKTRVADTMTDCEITSNQWYSVQIVWQSVWSDYSYSAFQVLIDGKEVKVGSADPVGDPPVYLPGSAFGNDLEDWSTELFAYLTSGTLQPNPDGTWFLAALNIAGGNAYKMLELETLGFKGTGAIANVSVSEEQPLTLTDTSDSEMGYIVFDPASPVFAGTVVTATAYANPGYEFNGWGVIETAASVPVVPDTENGNVITFTVTADMNVEALFKPEETGPTMYTVTVTTPVGGSIVISTNGYTIVSGTEVPAGTMVKVEATPTALTGYVFTSLSVFMDGVTTTKTTSPYTFEVIDDAVVSAIFTDEGGEDIEIFAPLIENIVMGNNGKVYVTVIPSEDGPYTVPAGTMYILRGAATLDALASATDAFGDPVDPEVGGVFVFDQPGDVFFFRADTDVPPIVFDFDMAAASTPPTDPVWGSGPVGLAYVANQEKLVINITDLGDNEYDIAVTAIDDLVSYSGFEQGAGKWACVLLKFTDSLVGRELYVNSSWFGTFAGPLETGGGLYKLDDEYGLDALMVTLKTDAIPCEKTVKIVDTATSEEWTFFLHFDAP